MFITCACAAWAAQTKANKRRARAIPSALRDLARPERSNNIARGGGGGGGLPSIYETHANNED